MATSMLHVRVDDELKAKATQALEAMGLSASDAVRLLFHRIVADPGGDGVVPRDDEAGPRPLCRCRGDGREP